MCIFYTQSKSEKALCKLYYTSIIIIEFRYNYFVRYYFNNFLYIKILPIIQLNKVYVKTVTLLRISVNYNLN